MRTRWDPAVGVQAGVVALRLGVADLAAGDEPGDPGRARPGSSRPRARLCACAAGAGAGVGRRDDPADRLGEPIGPDRLHDVVGGVDGERVDRVLVVGRDEDDLWPLHEPRDDPGQLHAVEPGHRDVGEDDVDVAAVEGAQGVGPARGGQDLGDAVVLAQQPAELLEGRRLVVDDERTQGCDPRSRPVASCGRRCSGSPEGAPAMGESLRRGVDARGVLGHPERHLRPGPGRGLDDEAEVVAVDLAQPGVDVAEPDVVAVGPTVEHRPDRLRVRARRRRPRW